MGKTSLALIAVALLSLTSQLTQARTPEPSLRLPQTVPDAGSTGLLLGSALAGLAGCKWLRRK
jgi:hypothetical protein